MAVVVLSGSVAVLGVVVAVLGLGTIPAPPPPTQVSGRPADPPVKPPAIEPGPPPVVASPPVKPPVKPAPVAVRPPVGPAPDPDGIPGYERVPGVGVPVYVPPGFRVRVIEDGGR